MLVAYIFFVDTTQFLVLFLCALWTVVHVQMYSMDQIALAIKILSIIIEFEKRTNDNFDCLFFQKTVIVLLKISGKDNVMIHFTTLYSIYLTTTYMFPVHK